MEYRLELKIGFFITLSNSSKIKGSLIMIEKKTEHTVFNPMSVIILIYFPVH